MKEVAIVGAARSPIGKFGGSLAATPATALGATAIRAALERGGIEAEAVDEAILGTVYQGGLGPNICRLAAVEAGLPYEVPSMTVNKLCGSGLKAVALAAQAIACGEADTVVAGGAENMSRVPHALPASRSGQRLGHGKTVDLLLQDGLWDCFYDCHMGVTAENLADEYGITRQEQDRFALRSQERAVSARDAGVFDEETVALELKGAKGQILEFGRDEFPRADTTLEKLAGLGPAFKEGGSVTAGNASGINDGAAALVLCRGELAKAAGAEPLAYIRAVASAGVDPRVMGIGPAPAIEKLLAKAGMKLDQIDLVEVNEAFAAQTLAVGRRLQWDEERLNVNGGAIALGHPVGASGARVSVSLLYEMRRRQARWGIAALCIGGGMGIAALYERA